MPEKMLIIQGKPVAKARPRFAKIGNFGHVYSPKAKEEKSILNEIKLQWKSKPLDCPVILEMTFLCPITKGSKKIVADMLNGVTKNIKKPDIDNYGKAYLDFLVTSKVIADDNLVYELALVKAFAQEPKTIIKVIW